MFIQTRFWQSILETRESGLRDDDVYSFDSSEDVGGELYSHLADYREDVLEIQRLRFRKGARLYSGRSRGTALFSRPASSVRVFSHIFSGRVSSQLRFGPDVSSEHRRQR